MAKKVAIVEQPTSYLLEGKAATHLFEAIIYFWFTFSGKGVCLFTV